MPPSRVRRVRVWLLVGGALAVSGCAALSGLDQYVKGDLDGSTDAIADQTVADVAHDAPTTDSGQDSSPPDASDGGGDVVVVQDGGSDAADAGDAECGALNTINNCSACGAACDGANATNTQCTGTTCQYTCKTGYSNCDAAAPDLNGCECPTPTCCGGGCATTHTNGVGQSYYDCINTGTYNATQAGKACTAYTNDQFACTAASCLGDAGDLVICGSPDGGGCGCWDYTGTDTGHVYKSGVQLDGSTTCFCPSTNDPNWN